MDRCIRLPSDRFAEPTISYITLWLQEHPHRNAPPKEAPCLRSMSLNSEPSDLRRATNSGQATRRRRRELTTRSCANTCKPFRRQMAARHQQFVLWNISGPELHFTSAVSDTFRSDPCKHMPTHAHIHNTNSIDKLHHEQITISFTLVPLVSDHEVTAALQSLGTLQS